MTYRSIAVHLDAGPRCAARTLLALQIAHRWEARLLGVAPTGLPDVRLAMSIDAPDAIEFVPLSGEVLQHRAEGLVTAFAARWSADRWARVEGRIVVAEPVDAVVGQARWCDLVVVGQTEPGVEIEAVAADLPQQVMLHAACPVLVVPYAGSFEAAPGQRIVVAWKDTQECARALHDALPFLKRATKATILESEDRASGADPGATAAARDATRAWLAAHGVAAEWRTETTRLPVGELILSVAADLSADLIVAGAYGHTRVRERLFGGVTRHLLAHMTTPTLFGH
jgi:nucleotide-binding universal stress UspA family protein